VTPKKTFSLSPEEMAAGAELSVSIRGLDGVALHGDGVKLVHGTHPAESIRWQLRQPAPDVLDLHAVVSPLRADRLLRMRYAVATGHPIEREVELTIVGRPTTKR
jgi:hypothetical protein